MCMANEARSDHPSRRVAIESVITWLIASTGSNMAPAIYVMIAAAISLVGTFYVRDPRRSHA